jgi:hypothetical protein
VKPSWEENAAERAIGKALAACFKSGDTIELDGIVTTRAERKEKDNNYMLKPVKYYTFKKSPNPS